MLSESIVFDVCGNYVLMNMKDKIILTGDRPTGRLHIGHYVGSLKGRVESCPMQTALSYADAANGCP